MRYTPINEKETDVLSAELNRLHTEFDTMTLEQLDGFFAALLAGPMPIYPQEIMPIILGNAFDSDDSFKTVKALEKFIDLIEAYWQYTAQTLENTQDFYPWIDADDGEIAGKKWAESFIQGMQFCIDDWNILLDDPRHQEILYPILALGLDENELDEDAKNGEPDYPACLNAVGETVAACYQYFKLMREEIEQSID